MHWWLYLYLAGSSPIKVPGHFDTQRACEERGLLEIQRFRTVHQSSPSWPWCVHGGIDDLELERKICGTGDSGEPGTPRAQSPNMEE